MNKNRRICTGIFVAFSFVFATSAHMYASPISVMPCSACFSTTEVATLSLNAFGTTNGKTAQILVDRSTSAIIGMRGSDDDNAQSAAIYDLGFSTGIRYDVNAASKAQGSAEAQVFGVYSDYIFIDGATPGSTLSVQGYFDFVGESTPTGMIPESGNRFYARLYLNSQTSSDCGNFDLSNFAGGYTGFCTSTANIPLEGKVRIDYIVSATASAIGGDAQAYVYGMSTAYLQNLQVFDSSGSLENGVRLYSASGVDHNSLVSEPGQSPVPEPSSLVMILTGLAGFCTGLRRIVGRGKSSTCVAWNASVIFCLSLRR